MNPRVARTRLLARGVCRLQGFLEAADCSALIALAEQRGFEQARLWHRGRRNRETFLATAEVRGLVTDLLREWQPAVREIASREASSLRVEAEPVGVGSVIEFYKYGNGESISVHMDTAAELGNGLFSQRTLVIYLNDDFDGGATAFPDFELQCSPFAGDALLFEHGVSHEATEVTRGIKYVLRASVLL